TGSGRESATQSAGSAAADPSPPIRRDRRRLRNPGRHPKGESMSSIVTNPLSNSTPATTTTPSVAPSNDPLANKSTFFKLPGSQLQTQDPLNPTDSNQFVSQLTAYSQLEQLIQIRQNTAPASTDSTPSTGQTNTGN